MKYALIIGNDSYTDPKLAQLKTPAADSRALANVLGDERIGGFDEVIPLINQTETEIRRAISSFVESKRPDDLVLVYFSGHGVLDSNGRLFLASKDTQTSILRATAIPSAFISDELDNCRSKRQILILDCCNSGAFARGTKAGEQKAITATTFEGSGYGRVVLTASDATQYALEGDQVIKQTEFSLFTHFLLEGLQTGKADTNNDGFVSLDEWYDYTYTNVLATTPTQNPHKWSYRQRGDLIIAKNPYYELIQHEAAEEITRTEAERLRQEKEKRELEILELEQTIRERLERETTEKAEQKKLENETAKSIEKWPRAPQPGTLETKEPNPFKLNPTSVKKPPKLSPTNPSHESINRAKQEYDLRRKRNVLRVFALLGLATLISGLFLSSPLLEKWFSPAPSATELVTVTATLTSRPAASPQTVEPNQTPTRSFTSTVTPLPTEITDAKGVSMMLVPSGKFTMGSNNGLEDERPIHEVYLDAYYIDKYEVTNKLYKACMNAGMCRLPSNSSSYTRSQYYGSSEYDDYPVIYVDWNMAKLYCEWRGAHLPTEAQWEKAARGVDERNFPWGDSFDGGVVNFCDKNCNFDWSNKNYDDGYEDTAPVGSYPRGTSPYGVYDLAGNVYEWVADWYSDSYYETVNDNIANPQGPPNGRERVMRGGAWYYDVPGIYSSYRNKSDPNLIYNDVGFRCARDANP